jgi:hypothetical protein
MQLTGNFFGNPSHNSFQFPLLIDHEDQINNNVQEGLTEDHHHNESCTEQTTEEFGTQDWTT